MSDGAPLREAAIASTKQYELVRWFAIHAAVRMRLKLRKPALLVGPRRERVVVEKRRREVGQYGIWSE